MLLIWPYNTCMLNLLSLNPCSRHDTQKNLCLQGICHHPNVSDAAADVLGTCYSGDVICHTLQGISCLSVLAHQARVSS